MKRELIPWKGKIGLDKAGRSSGIQMQFGKLGDLLFQEVTHCMLGQMKKLSRISDSIRNYCHKFSLETDQRGSAFQPSENAMAVYL